MILAVPPVLFSLGIIWWLIPQRPVRGRHRMTWRRSVALWWAATAPRDVDAPVLAAMAWRDTSAGWRVLVAPVIGRPPYELTAVAA